MKRKNFYVYNDAAIDRSMDHGCGRECVHTGEWTACEDCANGPEEATRDE